MDLQSELQALIERGLKFSIEMDGRSVLVWAGDYLRQSGAAATVASLEQAIAWLHEHQDLALPAEG